MRGFPGLLLIFLLSSSLCYGIAKTVEVVGFGECADCKENYIKTSQALSGLKVTIDCKLENGHFQRRGVGKLNEEGLFKVSLPEKILKDGKLAEECYVQLHNAANAPCAVHNGLEAAKIAFVSKSNEKHTFGTKEKLKFSSAICTSATFLPPPPKPYFPKVHTWLKKFGLPPKPSFKKPFGHVFPHYPLPPKPSFKKPCPPPVVPVPKPKPKPEPKPKPTPEPKPEPKPKPQPMPQPNPEPKPLPPVKKPCPPPVFVKPEPKPIPKPTIPNYKPHPKILPLIPVYKPHPTILPPPFPTYKPHPKILPSIPPFNKKPCPPFSLPKLPPLPTIPKKDFHHPLIPVPPHP